MGSSSIMIWLIIICVIFLIFSLIAKPIKLFIRFITQCCVGVSLMFLLNHALYGSGIFVGVNYITALIVGVLGLPGLISMYLLQVLM